MMITKPTVNAEQNLMHQKSIKYQMKGKHQPLLLELPETNKAESAMNLSASAASTRRSSARWGSDCAVSQHSSALSENKDSPKVCGTSALASYCDSDVVNMTMLIDEGENSNVLKRQKTRNHATNEILDRAFFEQYRKERE